MSASRIWISAISCGSLLGFGALQQPRALDVGLEHDVDQALGAVGRFLGQAPDAPSRRHLDVAMLGRDVVGDDVEQRALAAAVAADEADSRAVRNPNRGVLDQQPAGNADGKVVDDQHGALYGRARRATQSPMLCSAVAQRAGRSNAACSPVERSRGAANRRRPIMCVPGCQEAVQAALSRRGFFKGAAAAGFAATAVVPSRGRQEPRSRAAADQARGPEPLQGAWSISPTPCRRSFRPSSACRASSCRSSTTSRRTAST